MAQKLQNRGISSVAISQKSAKDGAPHDRQKAQRRRGDRGGGDCQGEGQLVPPRLVESDLGHDHEVLNAFQSLDAVSADLASSTSPDRSRVVPSRSRMSSPLGGAA